VFVRYEKEARVGTNSVVLGDLEFECLDAALTGALTDKLDQTPLLRERLADAVVDLPKKDLALDEL
jgi:hypothetical protein